MNRDTLLADLAALKADQQATLAPMQKRCEELLRIVEEQDRPRKELAQLQATLTTTRSSFLDRINELQRQIERAAPAVLVEALARARAERTATGGRLQTIASTAARKAINARMTQIERAESELENLRFVPGDLTDKVRAILVNLAESGLTILAATDPPAALTAAVAADEPCGELVGE